MGVIKTPEQIAIMRDGGKILAEALFTVVDAVIPGITTAELDAVFMKTIKHLKAESSFFGYHGYPKTICTSINNEVVHGIPSPSRVLKAGDIIGIDCGVRYKGMCPDMARTVPVGNISEEARQLIAVSAESLERAIAVMKPGNTIGDIGHAVQHYAEQHGYSVVRELVGHGVGEHVHEDPAIPNYGKPGTGLVLEPGMTLAVEPMVNIGKAAVVIEEDGWTIRTADGRLSAHFEDTILITATGAEVLTSID